ncbi:MAG: hypothetical protein JJU05_03415 [Verrucomicrobia bacterium]|nr:hypothetical protein [Verrucomicrobiota bacterium]MCH8527802.1 AsmA-like C-terminal region-containing protein [Kiritimatiellia bacterium]
MTSAPPIPKPRTGRRILAAVAGLLLFVLTLAGGLAVFGPPRFLISALLSDLEEQGLFLEMDQTGYRLERGIVLKTVRVYTLRDRVTPMLTADRVHIRLGWRRWLRQRVWSAKITFHGGQFETELGLWADDFVTQQEMRVRALRGHVRVNPSAIEVHQFEGRLSDLMISVAGRIPLGHISDEEPSRDWVPSTMRTLAEVIERIEEFRFTPLAEVDVVLSSGSHPDERVDVEARLSFAGTGQHRGFSLTAAEAELSYRNRQLNIPRAVLAGEAQKKLSGSARLDFREETASLRLKNTLPRYAVEHLSPVPLSELLENISIRVEGRTDVDLTFGPSPFASFGDRIAGTLDVEDAFYRDAFFPALRVDLSYMDRELHLENVRGEIGSAGQRGPVSGSFKVNLDTWAFRLDAQTGFNPRAVLSLIPLEDVQELLSEWSFVGAPPQMTVFILQDEAPESLELDLSLRGTEVLCRGIVLDELLVDIRARGMELRVPRLFARREARRLSAEATWDRTQNGVTFAVESTLPPDDMAVLIDAELAEFLLPYRIRGASDLKAAGRIDFSGAHGHALNARVSLEDVQWGWRRFDGVGFRVDLDGTDLSVRDIRGSVGDGHFSGELFAENLFTPGAGFSLRLDGRNLDLSEMIIAATDTEDTPYTGTLGFEVSLAGAVGDQPDLPATRTYAGAGRVEIREGELFRVPLLLGLSRILSRVFRGFGYASQTDFTARFEIGEGRARSDDLFLSGRMLSIEGEGWVDFDRQVQANIRVQAFRRGFAAEVVNFVLWPLRKLVEVRLTGTLDQPDWQLRNLP